MWQPMQRGNFSIATPGEHVCYQKQGPCGVNDANGPIRTSIEAGSVYTVQFQQNLNHFYTGDPGYMDISFARGKFPTEADFSTTLAKVMDYNTMNEVTQTNFSIAVTMPHEVCHECVIRVRYVSNNPLENDRGTIFYQCADIQLIPPPSTSNSHSNSKPKPMPMPINAGVDVGDDIMHVGSEFDCCSPPQFSTKFEHTIPDIDYSSAGILYYDDTIQFQRFDVVVGDGSGSNIYNGNFTMVSNFTSGREYYYNINDETCLLFGLDLWNQWCYGATYNQSEMLLHENIACSNPNTIGVGGAQQNCTQWGNGEFVFEAYSYMMSAGTCLPSSLIRITNGEKWFYSDAKIGSGSIPPNAFAPPPACKSSSVTVVNCD
jgi:hypothetical protein